MRQLRCVIGGMMSLVFILRSFLCVGILLNWGQICPDTVPIPRQIEVKWERRGMVEYRPTLKIENNKFEL